MIVIVLIIFGLYFICMILLLAGSMKISVYHFNEKPSKTRFSLVVPFRNESENLPHLLRSISKLNYPSEMLEIIFVDDFSEDNSVEIIEKMRKEINFPVRSLQNKRTSASPKKDAISEAIKHAKNHWIATTDADCVLPRDWLYAMDSYIQNDKNRKTVVMICGPVIHSTTGGFLEDYQFLDGLSLQFATLGGFGLKRPILCNGANLAYQKQAFEKVNGFYGNDHHASGDDVFLLEKMQRKFPGQVHFLKSRAATVYTKPQSSWKNVLQQRIRWGSKTSKLKNPFSIALGILVFLVNLYLLALSVSMVFYWENWMIWSILFFIKIILDYVILNHAAYFYGTKISISKTLWMSLVYIVITTLSVIGGFRGNYSWKGRNYRIK